MVFRTMDPSSDATEFTVGGGSASLDDVVHVQDVRWTDSGQHLNVSLLSALPAQRQRRVGSNIYYFIDYFSVQTLGKQIFRNFWTLKPQFFSSN